MSTTAILPVKRFAEAKQRLGAAITDQERHDLIVAMLRDVLGAISRARMVERTIVVTGEPEAIEIAAEHGAATLADPPEADHSAAAVLGVEAALARGATTAALLPGDCPLLDPRELDGVLTGLPSRYVTIIPDRHGSGTNGLVLAPPDALRPAFGEGSRERHVGLARAAGIPHSVEPVESLGLDLDTPADIVALTTAIEMGGAEAPHTKRALGI
jgi:2-phospho-L-lactate/phosphoenolpyruvate guanylyltransferase